MLKRFSAEYHGLRAQSIANDHLRVVYLTEAGPRLVGLYRNDLPGNFLAEVPDLGWDTPYGRFYMRGGHRLWAAPERFPDTSLPDNHPVEVEELEDGARLVQTVEPLTGIQKSIEFHLDEGRPFLHLMHRLLNAADQPIELAPWAITMLPPGGVAFLPQHHQELDDAGLLPNRILVLWPYTRLDDPRLVLKQDFWQVHADPDPQPLKVGALNLKGWMAYIYAGRVFCKRFTPQPGAPLPDMGCNAEIYTAAHMIELETLGPLVVLQPGESVLHTESWECYPVHPDPNMVNGMRDLVSRFEHV